MFAEDNFLCYFLLAWQHLFSNIFDLCVQIRQKKFDMIQQQSFKGFLRDSNPMFHEWKETYEIVI